jgi:molecular chaperone GrpE (heat shock protein)
MVSDRPTASVTGQDGWEWNERREADLDTGAERQHGEGTGGREIPPLNGDREAALERKVQELETELELAQHRYQRVLDRYERLLAKKNRKITDLRERNRAEGTLLPSSTVSWWRSD